MISFRDARPSDAPFLAKCIMAGMHFYDFETQTPPERDIYDRLVADHDMPHLIRLYESIGFRQADIRHIFGVEFQRMVYQPRKV